MRSTAPVQEYKRNKKSPDSMYRGCIFYFTSETQGLRVTKTTTARTFFTTWATVFTAFTGETTTFTTTTFATTTFTTLATETATTATTFTTAVRAWLRIAQQLHVHRLVQDAGTRKVLQNFTRHAF